MILKWIQVYVEDRKLQSQLITYSSSNDNNLMKNSQALQTALDRMQDERTVRIIIERGKI